MSKISEELHEAIMSRVGSSDSDKAEFVPVGKDGTLEEDNLKGVHMIKETVDHHNDQITRCIRRTYRKFAGGAPFESPTDARDRTEVFLLPDLVGTSLNALADGIQMGRKDSKVYKKYKTLRRLHLLLEAPGFREASDVLVMGYQTDPDCVEVIKNYIGSSFYWLGMASGYAADTDSPIRPHDVNKVWDLWSLAMRSVVIGMYLTGYYLGEQQKEAEERTRLEETFNQIVSSTGTDDG